MPQIYLGSAQNNNLLTESKQNDNIIIDASSCDINLISGQRPKRALPKFMKDVYYVQKSPLKKNIIKLKSVYTQTENEPKSNGIQTENTSVAKPLPINDLSKPKKTIVQKLIESEESRFLALEEAKYISQSFRLDLWERKRFANRRSSLIPRFQKN